MKDLGLWNNFYEYDAERPFEERTLAHSRLKLVHNQVKKIARLKPGKLPLQYLDIGIADGYLLKKARAIGSFKLYGLDIAHLAVKRLSRQELDTAFLQGSVTFIPMRDKTLDIVTACEVFEHLDDNNLIKAFMEIKRVLKRGGYFIATTPFKEDVNSSKLRCPSCNTLFNPHGHLQSYDLPKWKNILAEHNFRIVSLKLIYGTDFRLSKFRWGLPMIKLAARIFQVDSLSKVLVIAIK